LPLTGYRSSAFWSEAGKDRTELLGRALASLDEHRWGRVLDTGWFEWDLAVYCGSGLILRVVTAQEEHGQGKRLIRIRYRLAPTARLGVICAVSIVAVAVVALPYPRMAMGAAALVLGLGVRAWVRGLAAATRVIALFRAEAHRIHLIDCPEEDRPPSAPAASRADLEPTTVAGGRAEAPPSLRGAEGRGEWVSAFPPMVALDGPSPSGSEEQFA
jgi:hypothetical protein